MTTNDRNQDVDGLAQVLAEHHWESSDWPLDLCTCGQRIDASEDGLAAHQAAVVLAHLKERGTMSVWRFTYPATGRTVERTTIIWERDL